jgi:hypothetical protein
MALLAIADLTKPDSHSINATYSSDKVRGKVKEEVFIVPFFLKAPELSYERIKHIR